MRHETQQFSLTVLLCGVFWTGIGGGAEVQTLQVGDPVPEFQCVDDQGQLWKSRDHGRTTHFARAVSWIRR